jgi:hypothetical protein
MKHYKKVVWSNGKTMIAEVNWQHPDWIKLGQQKKYSIFHLVEGLWLDAGKSDNVEELEQYLTLVLEAAE